MTEIRFPWDEAPVRPSRSRAKPDAPKRPRGRPKQVRSVGRDTVGSTATLSQAELPGADRLGGEGAVEHTEWLPFRLAVGGPAETVAAFAAAAEGPGVTPWHIDFAAMEEDMFHRLASRYPRTGRLSLEGCRVFAAQLRERSEDRHRRVRAAAEASRARPLDLHALLPVPTAILALGPDHPDARRWLRVHWGTEELRQVQRLPSSAGRRPKGQAALHFGFFAADAGPAAAVRLLTKTWTDLRLDLQPVAGDAG